MTSDIIKVATPQVGEQEAEAVRQVLLSGHFVSGERVRQFEERFAAYIGSGHAVAVNSGTAALHIALEAMGVGRGDEVIVPPITFFATVSAVLYLGAVPVFADIDPDDLCLSPAGVAAAITPRTRAIVPVHLFGAAAKMDAFDALSRTSGIPVLEDCAQAHGSAFSGRRVGAWGRAGAFSFFATKHMTTGEGGMITTDDTDMAATCRIIRNHGMSDRDNHVRLGFNHRMTEMEAAMGLVQLQKLDDLNARRIANSRYLIQRLHGLGWARVPVPEKNVTHTFFWCPLMVDETRSGKRLDDLADHLAKHGIEFRRRYPSPLYRQPVLKRLGFDMDKVCLPNAEAVAGKVLGLPNHPNMTRAQLDRVVEVLEAF
jgi:dTDP-4-amino-4,6-dideoxygalactose transaminase